MNMWIFNGIYNDIAMIQDGKIAGTVDFLMAEAKL